jgi:methylmalonyl-CoA mutase cobalamin-binding subunit
MVYGDTISYTTDINLNLGIVANYVLWDILAQLYCPTGHAITPIPATEAMRVPSAEEILQIQVLGRKMETAARELLPRLDFSQDLDRKDRLVSAGRAVFKKALERLDFLGIDIHDPVRLLYVLKRLGPNEFETSFGVGEKNEGYLHHRKPVMMVDYYKALQQRVLAIEEEIRKNIPHYRGLRGRRVVLASTDVHEHVLSLLEKTLSLVGMRVSNIGSEKNAEEIVDALIELGGEVLAISTHNGMAHEFAKSVRDQLIEKSVNVPIFMGGRLNQWVEGEILPRDVTQELRDLDITPCASVDHFLHHITELFP